MNDRVEGTWRSGAQVPPWAWLLGGGALAAFGISRKSVPGAALAAAGGLLVYTGAKSMHGAEPVQVQRSVTINRPVEEVYRFWRNLENLPRFMSHLESVHVTGDRRSHWVARAPLGRNVEWDAEILDEKENAWIVWRSTEDASVPNTGSVQFRQAPGERGTEITVTLQYDPPAGKIGVTLAKLFGEEPEQQVREDLRHFKMLLEAGEIATTEGQPSGRRPRIVSIIHKKATSEPRRLQRVAW